MNPVIKFQLKKGRYTEMKHWNKEVAKEINPQITIKITKEDVVDILFFAFENYFCNARFKTRNALLGRSYGVFHGKCDYQKCIYRICAV